MQIAGTADWELFCFFIVQFEEIWTVLNCCRNQNSTSPTPLPTPYRSTTTAPTRLPCTKRFTATNTTRSSALWPKSRASAAMANPANDPAGMDKINGRQSVSIRWQVASPDRDTVPIPLAKRKCFLQLSCPSLSTAPTTSRTGWRRPANRTWHHPTPVLSFLIGERPLCRLSLATVTILVSPTERFTRMWPIWISMRRNHAPFHRTKKLPFWQASFMGRCHLPRRKPTNRRIGSIRNRTTMTTCEPSTCKSWNHLILNYSISLTCSLCCMRQSILYINNKLYL